MVEVALTKDGRFYVAGKEVVGQSGLETGIVEQYTKNPMATLVLRADKAADFQYAVDVLSIGAKLKMKTVIATELD
jgi:biopolymer transport protein ExbD